MKRTAGTAPKASPLYSRIRQILESARASAARSVNTTQVIANWLIGREIVEEEQKGTRKAGYGEQLLAELSVRLVGEYGRGYSATNLRWFRQFFLCYPVLVSPSIYHALRDELAARALIQTQDIHHATRDKFSGAGRISDAVPRKSATGALPGVEQIGHAVRSESWAPGQLHPNLSWTHYRTLLRVDKPEARAFYEIEAVKNNWAARELERQINSLLYERLALSRDKRGLMRLAVKGHEVQKSTDVFKDPVVMEFLGLPESPRLVETELEQCGTSRTARLSLRNQPP